MAMQPNDPPASSGSGHVAEGGDRGRRSTSDVKPGDLTLAMVWHGLPVRELYGVCVAILMLLGTAFGAGSWLASQTGRLELQGPLTELREKLAETESKLLENGRTFAEQSSQAVKTITKLENEKIELSRLLSTHGEQSTTSLDRVSRENGVLRIKQTFFMHALRYYQTHDRDHGRATAMFVEYLRGMWAGGKQDMERNSYYIFHNLDRPTDTCYIMFKDDPAQYQIPAGIKGEVLDFAR